MKLDFRSSENSYNLCFIILKLSGFAFFSIRTIPENIVEFYQSGSDYVILVFSILYSFMACFVDGGKSLKTKLQSPVMDMGTPLLWKTMILSMATTRIVHSIHGRKLFGIITNFKWLDREVCLNSF